MGWVPPRRRERSSRVSFVTKPSQHALHVYIDTHRLYIHTYILTKQIHTYTNTCMYIQTRPTPPHRGAGTYYRYTHTYLHTNTYIHPYMHVHTDTPPPTHRGGAGGKTTCPPLHTKNLCTPDPLGGGGWGGGGPAALGPIYIHGQIPCYARHVSSVLRCRVGFVWAGVWTSGHLRCYAVLRTCCRRVFETRRRSLRGRAFFVASRLRCLLSHIWWGQGFFFFFFAVLPRARSHFAKRSIP